MPAQTRPLNIAMWSGPRNLSTAMMYAFGARPDCAVWDEPFYAAYLAMTGLDHPMRDAILSAGDRDPARVASRCAAPGPRPLFYQKHMTHHMIDRVPRDWFGAVTHVFLIRHPARVLASYDQKRERATLADIGFAQQAQILDQVRTAGHPVTVIDSTDIRNAPGLMLHRLCAAIGITFDPAMLSWPAGGHPDDGIWAAHWYDAVHRSTGFAGPEGDLPDLSAPLRAICDAAMPYYETMRTEALTA